MNDRKAAGWSRRDFLRAATVSGTAGFLGLGSEAVEAQQPAKVPRIAYLGATSLTANAARVEAVRQGLRELGSLEGENIVIELRSAEGEQGRLPALVAEPVR